MNFEQREKAKRDDVVEKRLYVVEFESTNYCGASEHCLAWAHNEEDALDAASEYASEHYREQDVSQWEEENEGEDSDNEMWASMRSAVLLEGSEFAKYVEDEQQQRAFYQIVN